MAGRVVCRLRWAGPSSRKELLRTSLPKDHYVYALIVAKNPYRLIRIGASADFPGRLRGYPVADFIPGCLVFYSVVPAHFAHGLKPVLRSHFADGGIARPIHLRAKNVDYCVTRELKSIEYKVERLLLEGYRKRHGNLPPGNRMTGSVRSYLDNVAVVEEGPIHVLDMAPAALASMELSGEQLLRLLS